MMSKNDLNPRCAWVPEDKKDYIEYHDKEWGVPVHNDLKLFEMLVLEGAQAGLSWYTILKRREGYRKAFKRFDPMQCAKMTDAELQELLISGDIIKNKLKVYSVRKNAKIFLTIQEEFGSFNTYLWRYVESKPKVMLSEKPRTTSPESDKLSKDLKKRGMSFVGSTIMYAYMQAVGMVNDHMKGCYLAPSE